MTHVDVVAEFLVCSSLAKGIMWRAERNSEGHEHNRNALLKCGRVGEVQNESGECVKRRVLYSYHNLLRDMPSCSRCRSCAITPLEYRVSVFHIRGTNSFTSSMKLDILLLPTKSEYAGTTDMKVVLGLFYTSVSQMRILKRTNSQIVQRTKEKKKEREGGHVLY